jgi:hypothetical protein
MRSEDLAMSDEAGDRHRPHWEPIARLRGAILAAGLLVVALAAGWAAYQSANAVEPARQGMVTVASAPDAGTHDELQLVVGGIPRPFSSGSTIPIAGEIMARVVVSMPGDQRYARTIDLFLYRQNDSAPIDDARIDATAHMIYMDHGTFHPPVIHTDGGHYVLPVPFVMAGEWQLDMDIGAAGEQGMVQLAFTILD